MILEYCDRCGLRISDAEITSGSAAKDVAGKYVCAKCKSAVQLQTPTPSSAARRKLPLPAPAAAPARQTHAEVQRKAQTHDTWLIIGGAAVLLVAVLLVTRPGSSVAESASKPKTPPREVSVAPAEKPVEKPPESDPRSVQAWERLVRAKALLNRSIPDRPGAQALLREVVAEFHGNAQAEEAQRLLRELAQSPEPSAPPAVANATPAPATVAAITPSPAPASPSPATPSLESTQVLWENNFDKDSDFALIKAGTKDSQTESGSGASIKSKPLTGGYFVARVDLHFDKPLKLGSQPWLNFSYKMQGQADLCIHAVIGGRVYEKFIRGLKKDAWKCSGLRLNDFSKCIQTGKQDQPPVGAEVSTIVFFLGGKSKATLNIDSIQFGEGKRPKE